MDGGQAQIIEQGVLTAPDVDSSCWPAGPAAARSGRAARVTRRTLSRDAAFGTAGGGGAACGAVRQMMLRAGRRLELGRTNPHGLRHEFATAVLGATNGNTVIARDAGGWASARTVGATYGHTDLHDPAFNAALDRIWNDS
ncbi:hypothetical protein ACIBP6_20445 [Nonomuraea terrae]|uniref:hypothetical protein n=1 Tax=Nonomuraea terrae TaxID=2530383 RepID=UPI0037AA1628